jgi:hypothetical protein
VVVAAVAGAEAVLDWVTVTVTVVVAADFDFVFVLALAVRVDFVVVAVSVTVPGGCTVTVLDCELVRQTPGSLAVLQTPVSGGARALLSPAVVVPAPVSVAVPASLVVGPSVHAGVPDRREGGAKPACGSRPAGGEDAHRDGGHHHQGSPETSSSEHSRGSIASRHGASLPGGTWPPAPPGPRAACICSHHGTRVRRVSRSLWQGGLMQGGAVRTRNSVLWWGF